MKVLHLSEHSYANAGPSQVIFNHAKEQIAFGWQVDILSPYDKITRFYPLPEGVQLFKIKKGLLSRFIPYFSFQAIWFFIFGRPKYDIIHIHGVWHFPGIMPFLFAKNTPKIITPHGMLGEYSLKKNRILKKFFSLIFQKKMLQKASAIHVLHQGEKLEVEQYLTYSPTQLFILPNGLFAADYEQLPLSTIFRNKYGIGAEVSIILFLGRLDYKKGIDLLMPAFLSVFQQNSEVRLVLAGPDYGMLESIKSFAQKHGLEKNLTITGNLEKEAKLAALSAANVFVLPSYSEGFSMAVLEANIVGLPVVVSPNTGFSEEIAAAQAGIICSLESEAIAAALLKIIPDKQLQNQMGMAGKNLVSQQYEMKNLAKELMQKMESLVGNSK